MLAQEYEKKHPERRVEVQPGGSAAGFLAASNGLADVGMSSRELTAEEAKEFTAIVIARDGLAIVVHPSNPVTGLTTEQIRGIFAGRVKDWKEAGGPDLPIRAIVREEGSGTRESFQTLVMHKDVIARGMLVQPSNGAVREAVRNDPGAIGCMSLGVVTRDVKPLRIDGVFPNHQTMSDGTYALSRPFIFLVKGAPSPEAQAFIDFVLSDEGQSQLEKEGLTRVK
jgi:phosphate transport system substrate-binding protein